MLSFPYRAHFDTEENSTPSGSKESKPRQSITPSSSKESKLKGSIDKPNLYRIQNETKEQPKKPNINLRRLELAQPFNLFFTKVQDIPSTQKDKYSFFMADLLHSCHGELKVNFLVPDKFLGSAVMWVQCSLLLSCCSLFN